MSFLWESLWLFFPQPTWRSHTSTDFDAKWLKRRRFTNTCAFWSKNRNFLKPLTPRPQNRQNLPNFGRDLENFRSISRLTLGVSRVNTPCSSSEPNKTVRVNRQCGGGKFKYVPKFCIGGTDHVISRMRNDNLHWWGTLEPNISKTVRDRGSVSINH